MERNLEFAERESEVMSSATIPGRNGREASVQSRYAGAAREKEESLCCPVR